MHYLTALGLLAESYRVLAFSTLPAFFFPQFSSVLKIGISERPKSVSE